MNAFSFFAALTIVFGLSTALAGECHSFVKGRDYGQGQFVKLTGVLAPNHFVQLLEQQNHGQPLQAAIQKVAIVLNLDQEVFIQGAGRNGATTACPVRSITLYLDEREMGRARVLMTWEARVAALGAIGTASTSIEDIRNGTLADALVSLD